MSSALRFAVAGVIVALFGGFLLAGVLTTPRGDEMAPAAVTESPSPMTTEALLSGMVTEEVEPGVFRVLDDGAGHAPGATEANLLSPRTLDRLHVEPDGSVWVATSVSNADWNRDVDKAVGWQVGVPGRYGQRDGFPGHLSTDMMGSQLTYATAPDGTLWAAGGWGLGSFDGDAWTPHGEGIWANTVAALPDGTVWAAWPDRIGRLGPEGWEWFDVNDGVPREVHHFAASPEGRVFATGSGRLVAFDGAAWQDVQPLDTDTYTLVDDLRVGPGGTLWAHVLSHLKPFEPVEAWHLHAMLADDESAQHHLVRLDGDTWTVYSPSDGVPKFASPGYEFLWDVHPDGSLWLLADVMAGSDDAVGALWSFDGTEWTERSEAVEQFTIGPAGRVWAVTPDGIVSFDGSAWRPFLAGYSVSLEAIDVAPDGSLWLLANEPGHVDRFEDLYVITPEAVAAAE